MVAGKVNHADARMLGYASPAWTGFLPCPAQFITVAEPVADVMPRVTG